MSSVTPYRTLHIFPEIFRKGRLHKIEVYSDQGIYKEVQSDSIQSIYNNIPKFSQWYGAFTQSSGVTQ
jgi:hypothetical protein